MAALDWIFLAALLLSMLIGAWRGLVFELLSVLGWILSFFVAQWLAADMAAWLPMGDSGAALCGRLCRGVRGVGIFVRVSGPVGQETGGCDRPAPCGSRPGRGLWHIA